MAGFFEGDALIDVLGAAGEHGVDEAGKFVGDGGDHGRRVEPCGEPTIVGAKRRLTVPERRGRGSKRLRRLVAGAPSAG